MQRIQKLFIALTFFLLPWSLFAQVTMVVENRKVTGVVLDSKSREPVKAEITFIKLPDQEHVGKLSFNPVRDSFQLTLNAQSDYLLSISSNGYLSFVDTLAKEDTLALRIVLEPVRSGQKIVLKNVVFERDDYKLMPQAKLDLDQLVSQMRKNKSMRIRLHGHTDYKGNSEQNIVLSEKRVQVVKDYLVQHGIKSKRIKTEAHGGGQPLVKDPNASNRAANRRVEMEVLKF